MTTSKTPWTPWAKRPETSLWTALPRPSRPPCWPSPTPPRPMPPPPSWPRTRPPTVSWS